MADRVSHRIVTVTAIVAAVATLGGGAAADGRSTFERACAACHGTSGRGNGPGAFDLNPRPRDLTTPAFRFRSTPSGAAPRPEDLERTIRRGLPGSAMPAFNGLLSDAEIAGLVAFVGSLGASGESPPDPVPILPIPPATPDSIEEGRSLYTLLECWRCHGVEGDGRGPSAKALVDDDGRPIRATDFRHDPLKGGRRPADLARSILTGLNGTPMPSYADALVADGQTGLRDARLASLVHFVMSLDRRSSFGSIVFRQKPELEPRSP